MAQAHLTVEVGEPFAMLRKVLQRKSTRKGLEAVLSFDGENLLIDFQGGQVSANASGTWSGVARISLSMLHGIAKTHAGQTAEFEYEGGRMRIGPISVAATWQDLTSESLELPLDATDTTLLSACLTAAPSRVIASGLSRRFEKAREVLTRNATAAQRQLAQYGITAEEIEAFVVERLKRGVNLDTMKIARAWAPSGSAVTPAEMPPACYRPPEPVEEYTVFVITDNVPRVGGDHYIAVHKQSGVVHDLGFLGE